MIKSYIFLKKYTINIILKINCNNMNLTIDRVLVLTSIHIMETGSGPLMAQIVEIHEKRHKKTPYSGLCLSTLVLIVIAGP